MIVKGTGVLVLHNGFKSDAEHSSQVYVQFTKMMLRKVVAGHAMLLVIR